MYMHIIYVCICMYTIKLRINPLVRIIYSIIDLLK